MRRWNLRNTVFTIPNLLSFMRLAFIPVYLHLLYKGSNRQHALASILLVISCLSDALDGYIARRFHCVSTLGKILDPFADKCTQLALLICICMQFSEMTPVLILFCIKELFQLLAGVYFLRKNQMLNGALYLGKVSTAVLFSSSVVLILFPDIPSGLRVMLVRGCAAALTAAFISYLRIYFFKPSCIPKIQKT